MSIASPKLEVSPMFASVILNPEAIPRRFAGTEPMIELTFGETQSPVPTPKIASAMRMTVTPLVEFTRVRVKKAIFELAPKPTSAKFLVP